MLTTPAMHIRLSTVAFLIYVGLDLSSPFVPGVFTFDADSCIEMTHRDNRRSAATPTTLQAYAAPSQAASTQRLSGSPSPSAIREPRVESRLPIAARRAPPSPPSPSDDH